MKDLHLYVRTYHDVKVSEQAEALNLQDRASVARPVNKVHEAVKLSFLAMRCQ